MKPPTAKLTLAVFSLPSSHSLAARGMIHLSRPFRVLIYGDPWQRWPRKASSGAAIPLANGAAAQDRSARDERQPRQRRKTAAPGTKDSRARDERQPRQRRKTAAPGTKDSRARDERQPRQRRKTAAPGTKDSRARDERQPRQRRKTAAPGTKDSFTWCKRQQHLRDEKQLRQQNRSASAVAKKSNCRTNGPEVRRLRVFWRAGPGRGRWRGRRWRRRGILCRFAGIRRL